MKIASLLPSATEILYALGMGDQVVGVTHECDYPEAALAKPKLTASSLDHRGSASAQIDRHINEQLHLGSSVYRLDRSLLEELSPDLIITQELCDVCAVSYQEVQQAVKSLYGERQVLSLNPVNLEEMLGNILAVGEATGVEKRAENVVAGLRERAGRVEEAGANVSHRPRVYCMEWVDPPYASGHWVPGMVEMAGGVEGLGRAEERSRVVSWREIAEYDPKVILLIPCGYDLEETISLTRRHQFPKEWHDLRAVRDGKVWAVNGSAYFNRPGPRLVDGLEILLHILHPEVAVRELRPGEAQLLGSG